MAGFGTVGSGVWKILAEHGDLITARSQDSARLEIRKIAVRDLGKQRDAEAPADLFTNDLNSLVEDPSVDVILELIGGTDAAFDLVAAALKASKPVVTGNKALLAERGQELFALSREHHTPIHFEAAVAGGIPVIKAVQESLIGNQIKSIAGIINGTSNYILQRMTEAGLGYPEALKEAKDLGYAEADETLDVNGWDAAHKAILLGSLAHGFLIDHKEVYVRGIEKVTPLDIRFASELGYVVKLLSLVIARDNGHIEIRTQPSFLSKSHILASVHGVNNAVAIKGDHLGDSLFYGPGAGQGPTASSVVSDLVEAARNSRPDRGFLPLQEMASSFPSKRRKPPTTSVSQSLTARASLRMWRQSSQIMASESPGLTLQSMPTTPMPTSSTWFFSFTPALSGPSGLRWPRWRNSIASPTGRWFSGLRRFNQQKTLPQQRERFG